jgi:hypothetical protein
LSKASQEETTSRALAGLCRQTWIGWILGCEQPCDRLGQESEHAFVRFDDSLRSADLAKEKTPGDRVLFEPLEVRGVRQAHPLAARRYLQDDFGLI